MDETNKIYTLKMDKKKSRIHMDFNQ